MRILTLTEVIFEGQVDEIDFTFLENLINKSHSYSLNYTEEVILPSNNIINNMDYVDLCFSAYTLNSIPYVFVNLIKTGQEVKLFYFFDLKDSKLSLKDSLDEIIDWGANFKSTHSFTSFECHPDLLNEDDYYFRNGSYGSCYYEVKRVGNVAD